MKTKVSVTFGLYDTTAKTDSSLTATSKQDWVDLTELQREEQLEPLCYGDLEHNYWLLDDSREVLPNQPTNLDLGLWSTVISDGSGVFAVPPELRIDFLTAVHSSIGLTFRFYEPTGDYCSLLNIAWYGEEDNLLKAGDYEINSPSFFVAEKILDYKKIVITFKKTSLPYRFVKLTGIEFGEKITWSDRDLTEGHMREQLDLSGSSLSINTLNFTVCADDERFDIYNPQGVYEVLQERQAIKVQRYSDGKELDSSTFYLNSWEEANANPAKLEAYDLIGLLDTVNYHGDLFNGYLSQALIADILDTAGVPYMLDTTLENIEIHGWLPQCSCREALANVLFAVGAAADCSRSDKIKIYPLVLTDAEPETLPMSRQAFEQETKQYKAVTGVELKAHSYKIKSGAEVSDIYEEDFDELGTVNVDFSEPHDVYKVTSGNAVIEKKWAAGMVLRVTQTGTVTVSGWKYDDNVETLGYYRALKAGEKENLVTTDIDCTLISKRNAKAVAERLYNYYLNRYELNLEILQQSETVGQTLRFENLRQKQFVGFAEELDIDLCGGFVAQGRFVGTMREAE